MRTRIEALQMSEPSTGPKGCRSFAGVTSFLGLFCQDLQNLLKPIYDLIRNGRLFHLGQGQQEGFKEIRRRPQKLHVLHMPDNKGIVHLYSDMSTFTTGSALYQVQNGQLRSVAYANKRIPPALQNYSITDLELCGLAINISDLSHLLKKVDLDAVVDHLTLMHIMKSKTEPGTNKSKDY